VNAILFDHEAALRLGVFGGVFAVMAIWEMLAPRRQLTTPKGARWRRNLSLTLLNGSGVRFLVPLQAVGVAALAAKNGWGLLPVAGVHPAVAIALAVVALDLAIYAQHWYFHRNPLLWRLHMVHHVDLDIDVTTGARFHPLEILLSMAIKMALVLAIGAPVVAVVLFEILLNATSMFNHGNVRMGAALDRALRAVLVTPDMHRVHHSVIPRETFSNFGFNLPWWDRLFGTYRAQPQEGHDGMAIGLPWFRDPGQVVLGWLLVLPFRKRTW
jgi:sterol desaturase/sphingolipid hydroxylase (fatty acid hydroxylase superfamily)